MLLSTGGAGAGAIGVQQSVVPALVLEDYATLPITGAFGTVTGNRGSLARINFMRPEPGRADRLWINDLNGPLYLFDTRSKTVTTYLDFNGRDGRGGLFERFTFTEGFANGLISFAFHPDYPRTGRFYTLHLEDPAVAGRQGLVASRAPGVDLRQYAPLEAEPTPGPIERESVLLEWTDSQLRNQIFEGTVREILRIQLNRRTHPTGDLTFNPTARPGDAEWGVLYIGSGDGGSGEQRNATTRMNPQRLDTLVGKILRIVPDLSAHPSTSTISRNGRYRVPRDNPFVGVAGARGEVWALGFRNPHRLLWGPGQTSRDRPVLLAASIGLYTWETLNVVHRGGNYGYPEREGTQRLTTGNVTEPRPDVDRVLLRVSDSITAGDVAPRYPVLQFGHDQGQAIMGAVLYDGTRLPALRGHLVFGDIVSGRLFSARYRDLLAADDDRADTLAAFQALHVRWTNPASGAGGAETLYGSLAPVVAAAHEARRAAAWGAPSGRPTRADVRLATDAAGELYILSKVDGVIRRVVAIK